LRIGFTGRGPSALASRPMQKKLIEEEKGKWGQT